MGVKGKKWFTCKYLKNESKNIKICTSLLLNSEFKFMVFGLENFQAQASSIVLYNIVSILRSKFSFPALIDKDYWDSYSMIICPL